MSPGPSVFAGGDQSLTPSTTPAACASLKLEQGQAPFHLTLQSSFCTTGARPPPALPTAPPLESAPGAPIRRRKPIRRIIFLLLLLTIGLSGWRWGPAVKQHAQLLYWQRQCMNYQIPSNALLYEQDPKKA